MVAACVGAGKGATGKSAQLVGLKPLTFETGLQISADTFVEANHLYAFSLFILSLKKTRPVEPAMVSPAVQAY